MIECQSASLHGFSFYLRRHFSSDRANTVSPPNRCWPRLMHKNSVQKKVLISFICDTWIVYQTELFRMFWFQKPKCEKIKTEKTEKTDDDGDRYRSHRALLNQLANNTSLLVFSTFTHNTCEALSPLQTDLDTIWPAAVVCSRLRVLLPNEWAAIQNGNSNIRTLSCRGHHKARSSIATQRRRLFGVWLVVVCFCFWPSHGNCYTHKAAWKALMRLQGIEYFGELCGACTSPPTTPGYCTAKDCSVLGARC